MQDEKHFKTNDLCLATFLLTKEVKFTGLNKDASGRATFLFVQNTETSSLVDKFSKLQASVEPIGFHAAMKKLKQLLYLN